MTIGIVASGPGAGLAIFRALSAVERVGTGAIGGFVSFVAITTDGRLLRADTQRGGSGTLFVNSSASSGDPNEEFANAPMAALMSSGPDRPEPLSQFTPGAVGVGLVSGHRLPNADLVSGMPLNASVLEEMKNGRSAEEAASLVLEANPEADAGIIALDSSGNISVRNSELVNQRADIGSRLHIGKSGGLSVGVLHNSIFPHRPIADLATETALHCVTPINRSNGSVSIAKGTPLVFSGKTAVHIDQQMNVVQIDVDRETIVLPGTHQAALIPFLTEIVEAGSVVGHTVQEPYCVVKDGNIDRLSGAEEITLAVQWRR